MKKIFVFAALFLAISLQPIAHASFIQILPGNEFSVGDEVKIRGYDFGDGDSEYTFLCFNSGNYCFAPDADFIDLWDDTKIDFTAPILDEELVNFSGSIHIFGKALVKDCESCTPKWISKSIDSVLYKILPTVSHITDQNGNILNGAFPGSVIDINGFFFGENKYRIMFSGEKAEILSWSERTIRVKVPLLPKEAALQNTIVIERNKTTKSKEFNMEVYSPIDNTNDELSGVQDYLLNAKIDKMWQIIKPKSNVVVAIIDDGVYLNHSDLKDAFWTNSNEIIGNGIDDDNNGYLDDKYGWNFIDDSKNVDVLTSHGTFTAGIIAANKNNNIGIAGIAAGKAKIMPLIACNKYGCIDENVIDAIYYATNNGARVINLSLGGTNMTSYNASYNEALKYASDRGVVIVIAAGNGDTNTKGINTTEFKISPVCNESNDRQIIGVGASTSDNKYLTSWTNYGDCVDIYAQGENIVSTSVLGYEYDYDDGTSFSAPIITGIAAYVLSAYPEMSNTAFHIYLTNNSDTQIVNAEKMAKSILEKYSANSDIGAKWSDRDEVVQNDLFPDINSTPFRQSINSLSKRGIISGYPDGSFRPQENINRAEFVKIIVGAVQMDTNGSNCFSDVKNQWFSSYVCSAKSINIIGGYPDGSFGPSKSMNVAEALKITLNAFKVWTRDEKSNEQWYQPFVERAKEIDIYLDSFSSTSKNINRGEMAEIINKLLIQQK